MSILSCTMSLRLHRGITVLPLLATEPSMSMCQRRCNNGQTVTNARSCYRCPMPLPRHLPAAPGVSEWCAPVADRRFNSTSNHRQSANGRCILTIHAASPNHLTLLNRPRGETRISTKTVVSSFVTVSLWMYALIQTHGLFLKFHRRFSS